MRHAEFHPHARVQPFSMTKAATTSLTAAWEGLPASWQFAVLVANVFFFFGLHNLLQEAIMSLMDRKFGVMLGYTEVLGVAFCTSLEHQFFTDPAQRIRQAPWTAYPWLTLCLMASSALSNMSLNYINFPTKVVFRSSKLIPTMLMASVMHHQRFTVLEYTCAAAICAGLVLFAAADWELTPSFHPVGLVLVTASVVADAVLPNAQQALFTRYQASRLEVTLYTNLLTLAAYTLTTTLSGDMFGFFALLRVQVSRQLLAYFCIYTLVSYAAITAHMTVVRRYGGVAAVLVATARKGITLVLSFVLFPKAFSWYYPAGATMVLGGLLTASLYKQRNKSKAAAAAARPASPIGPSPHQC